MTREQIFSVIRAHLADELEVDPDSIERVHALPGGPRSRLARPVHARSGARGHLRRHDLRRAGRQDPDGRAGGRVRARERRGGARARLGDREPRRRVSDPERARDATAALLQALLDELPARARDGGRSRTSSWTAKRADSYERLAFLGDSVLSLAVTSHLYPSLEADRFGAGQLTKIRAQAVSGRSCRAVAERLGLPAAPARGRAGERRLVGAGADRDRARAGVGDRGGDRRLLPRVRLRAHRRGGRRGVRDRARGGARASDRLQVGAPGAARAPRRGRQLLGHLRAGPAARPDVLHQPRRSRAWRSDAARGRSKKDAEQDGRAGGARGDGTTN